MPNIKSAKKRVDTAERNRARNKSVASRMKTEIKKFDKAVADGDVAKAEELLPKTVAVIDKTAKKGVIHKNAADRRKARATEKLDTLKNNK